MSAIKEIRELTGLSQGQVASWLGISKSLLQFAEKAERSLPHEASIKLSAMLLLAQQIKTAGKDSMAGETNFSDSIKLAKKHKRKIEFHQKSAAALQAQLAKIKSMHPQVNSRLALLEALKNNSIEWYSTTEQDKTWIKFTEWFSKERISKTGLEEQELLKDKIEVHLAYAEVHKKQLEKFAT